MTVPDSGLLSIDELALAVGVSRRRLTRLVALGVVDAVEPDSLTFTAATAVRVRRMFRLHRDLGVNILGAAIILDLVERIERMQSEMAARRAHTRSSERL